MTQEERDLRNAYRNCFMSSAGRRVLGHMLTELGFFNTAASEEEVTLQNYAKVLLRNLGILSHTNINRLTSAILDIPVVTDEPEREGEYNA